MSYQERDQAVIDYEMFLDHATGLQLRGPAPLARDTGRFLACVGAAQTFGCFVQKPFPALLGEALQMPAWNLGIGGAGPRFFDRPRILSELNRARVVVLQVMSGRSESNRLFDAGGHAKLRLRADGRLLFADAAWGELFDQSAKFWPLRAGRKWVDRLLARFGRAEIKALVQETQEAYLQSLTELIQKIEVPIVLLWFSKRSPDYAPSYRNVWTLFGEYPHLVDRQMIERMRPLCAHYVEVTSARGSPQLLRSREDGRPIAIDPGVPERALQVGQHWTHNAYYPSPEMHEDAFRALFPVLKAYQSSSE